MTALAWADSAACAGEDLSLFFPPGEDRDWTDQALCAQSDPDAWFPEKGGSVTMAKLICGRCPVRAECLEFALETEARLGLDSVHGVWGGLGARERRAVLRGSSERNAA